MTVPATEICERLASLGRSGYPLRRALQRLPDRVERSDATLEAMARRAALGFPIPDCVGPSASIFGPEYQRLLRCLAGACSTGSDWAGELDAIATSIRARTERDRAAKISGAGAALSARTISFLPFLMLPVAVKQVSDPAIALCVGLGVALGYSGYRWLLRIVPEAPGGHPEAELADEVAAALGAGASLEAALRDAAGRREDLKLGLRRVRLGARWADVLTENYPSIARAVRDASGAGVPIAVSLRRSAIELRREATQDFERDVERAPVRMVVPLVCCILPSFVLVAIVPLLNGLAQPS